MKRFFSILLIIPIKAYRVLISPLFPPKCIYFPSCSQYSLDAIKGHGPFKGFVMGFLRVFRCSPLFIGGVDQVQKEVTLKVELGKYKKFIRGSSK